MGFETRQYGTPVTPITMMTADEGENKDTDPIAIGFTDYTDDQRRERK
jgi:hypothetical protein